MSEPVKQTPEAFSFMAFGARLDLLRERFNNATSNPKTARQTFDVDAARRDVVRLMELLCR